MTVTPETPIEPPKSEAPKPEAPKAEEPLREPGLKALQAERERADKAEAALKGFEPYRAMLDGLKGVFAPAPEAQPEDLLRNITARLDAADRRADVADLARRHAITNDEDVKILAAIDDPATREALAARLKGQAAAIPPDPGQGQHPGPQSDLDAAYRSLYPDQKVRQPNG